MELLRLRRKLQISILPLRMPVNGVSLLLTGAEIRTSESTSRLGRDTALSLQLIITASIIRTRQRLITTDYLRLPSREAKLIKLKDK